MKTTVLNSSQVYVKISLSELLEGMKKYKEEMYLCMVVQRMVSEEFGFGNGFIKKYSYDGHEIRFNHFQGITDQMLENFAPLLGIDEDEYKGFSSIQAWANKTIHRKSWILPDEKVIEMSQHMQFNDRYMAECACYRIVLLERLIYQKDDREISFVMTLVKDSPASFAV